MVVRKMSNDKVMLTLDEQNCFKNFFLCLMEIDKPRREKRRQLIRLLKKMLLDRAGSS